MPVTTASDLATTLNSLHISTNVGPSSRPHKPKPAAVADSWEDEVDDDKDASGSGSGSATETEDILSPRLDSPLQPIASKDVPAPPPPTPASPLADPAIEFTYPSPAVKPILPSSSSSSPPSGRSPSGSTSTSPARRPEKTTSVANRLIAGALGVRPPRRTEAEREFDRVTRQKERERREREREEVRRRAEEAERARRSVWED